MDSSAGRMKSTVGGVLVGCVLAAGCGRTEGAGPGIPKPVGPGPRAPVEVARSTKQWTGVAVAPSGRVFVSYPRWSDDVPVSVAELRLGKADAGAEATVTPFPDAAWNGWRPGDGSDVAARFVAVQSVVATADGTLWVLDPGNPKFAGVIEGAPKLVAVDLGSSAVREVIRFDAQVASGPSYLNDVRFDLGRNVAYLTDSGRGGLVVLDLATKRARRVLDAHPSTHAEDVDIVFDGGPWRREGARPKVHADGIALTRDGAWLYYQALTGKTLYRVPTAALRDASLSEAALGTKVEKVGEPGPADGLEADAAGILHTSLEANAVRRFAWDGTVEVLAQDKRLAWPDSLAIGPGNTVWITTSQIHRGATPPEPYRLWKLPSAAR